TGSGSKTITTDISGHKWNAGYSLTYVIGDFVPPTDQYDYFFSVAEQPTMDYTGKLSDNGKIVSYRKHKTTNAEEALGWTVEGYYTTEAAAQTGDVSKRIAKGAAGTFIKDFLPEIGSGSITGEQIKISYPGAEYTSREDVETGSAKDAIIAATPKKERQGGKAYNLSNPADPYSDVVMNTANTYIINGAGYYRFPIVMGNGVKDGGLNTVAYNQTGFVDYKDRAITDPYLRGTVANEVPTAAVLAWETGRKDTRMIEVQNPDAGFQHLTNPPADITGYYLDFPNATNGISKTTDANGDVYWVNFHVNSAVRQGVAHITIRDADGACMWSWLIWLTDYKLGEGDVAAKALVNAYQESEGRLEISFMARPMGWVDDATKTVYKYPAATPAYMRLIQNESGEVAVVKLTRPAYNLAEQTTYRIPYYQWGRVTPIWPADNDQSSTSNVGVYFGFYRGFNDYGNQESIGWAIQQPSFFMHTSSGNSWTTTLLANLWNADETKNYEANAQKDIPVKKTIYDPSPVGYTVPRRNAATAFMKGYATELSTYNVYYGANNSTAPFERGYTLYSEWCAEGATPTGQQIYLPGMGCLQGRTGTYSERNFFVGYYQLAARSSSSGSALHLRLGENRGMQRFFPFESSHAATAIPILPQREE
ncbi:MAG: hypothetical protein IKI67_08075, partial [Bacteroidales bacterium]|nr:hypothetical protein [Bacteroidales bacterium]